MAAILTNRAFPGFVASIGAAGAVVATVAAPGNLPQQWEFLRVVPAQAGLDHIQSAAAVGVFVGTPPAALVPPFNAAIVQGGAENEFVPEVVDGGIRICLPGAAAVPDLFWTLVAGAVNQPIALMPLGAVPAATQIWDVAPA